MQKDRAIEAESKQKLEMQRQLVDLQNSVSICETQRDMALERAQMTEKTLNQVTSQRDEKVALLLVKASFSSCNHIRKKQLNLATYETR